MVGAIALLLACLLAGEMAHIWAGAPLPGSVAGLLLLLVILFVRPAGKPLQTVSGWLTAHLSIMFVPAAVGLMQKGDLLARHGVGIVVATVVSVVLTMLVTVLVFNWGLRRRGDAPGDGA